jgi:ATP-dependent DNA ligase
MNPTDYKNKVASRYISVEPSQIGLKIIESDFYLCSNKLDGHLGILSIENKSIKLFNRSGKILEVPSIEKAAKSIKKNVVLAGEICVYNNGRPGTNSDVTSALADPEKYNLRFGVYDIISEDGKPVDGNPKLKFDRIKDIASINETIFAIEHHIFESRKDVIEFFNKSLPDHEGIVVRTSSEITYKVKQIRTIDLVILGFAEGIGERKGMVRDLMLGCLVSANEYLIVGHCGNGFSDDQRKELFDKLNESSVDSDYLEISGAKTAFVMVKPKHIAEITCLDMIGETASANISKTLLKYDTKKGYLRSGTSSSISMISPVFVRLRNDKTVSVDDAGINQIKDFLVEHAYTKDIISKKSEVVAREVFTKSSKGNTAVRKFIILKTNREETGEFSPFVVVYTDFSGGRKTPLEQEIYLCETMKHAKQKIIDLKDENIKKGWEPYN